MQDGKYVVLCIDDDRDVRECLEIILGDNRFLPVLADSAAEGLQAYKTSRPDLIVVDMMMETPDAGTDFVKTIREQDSEIPIYMLSSVGDGLSMNVDTAALGLNGVLQKPIDRGVLLDILKARLS